MAELQLLDDINGRFQFDFLSETFLPFCFLTFSPWLGQGGVDRAAGYRGQGGRGQGTGRQGTRDRARNRGQGGGEQGNREQGGGDRGQGGGNRAAGNKGTGDRAAGSKDRAAGNKRKGGGGQAANKVKPVAAAEDWRQTPLHLLVTSGFTALSSACQSSA